MAKKQKIVRINQVTKQLYTDVARYIENARHRVAATEKGKIN